MGNPPYITYSELAEEEQIFVKNNFATCVKGKFDYCYAFIEKSIKSLSNDGKMSYLIPSSFDKALVKSSIMVLDKQRRRDILYYQDIGMEIELEIPIAGLEEKWFFSE